MTIKRYDIHGLISWYPHVDGDLVRYKDHLEAVEKLEYDLRAMEEEMVYWKEKYFEYYEQDQL